jgi:NAD(P)-dependent dehydrogenase (short-subunit alcohol dehydrogenase family)
MTQLANQTVVVTGANRGLGRELDGIEADASEILADDLARAERSSLNQPVGARYAPFLPEAV